MEISKIHSFLVGVGKGVEIQEEIKGTDISIRNGRLYDMLNNIFLKASNECTYDIAFSPNQDGEQINPTLNLIKDYINLNGIEEGRSIAKQLQTVTTNRSGLGLLFLIVGMNGSKHRIVISRFRADTGVLAEELQSSLAIEYVERVFMKSARTYKAVMYEGESLDADFWTGKAIDKQINGDLDISEYWITDFLLSDFATTGARGTRNFANALKTAINKSDSIFVKEELIAVMTLARGLDGQVISPESLFNRLGASEDAIELIKSVYKESAYSQQFKLQFNELNKHISYKSVELDNGALISAGIEKFENIFSKVENSNDGTVEYSTKGKIISQKVQKSK